MTESAEPQRWEDRVLTRLWFLRRDARPTSVLHFVATAVIVVVFIFVRPLPVALGIVVVPLIVLYWTAFWAKVVRSFRDGYRQD